MTKDTPPDLFDGNRQHAAAGLRARLARLTGSRRTETFITLVIVLNAIVLGLETSERVMASVGPLLMGADKVMLAIFVAEIAARLYVHRLRFFRDPWSVFDFVVVGVALIPATGAFSVLRALRVLRVLRLITVAPSLRKVVSALISAMPGMGAIVMLLGLIFYVASVMATMLFGEQFPQWFGSLGASAYSLFQIMTLESWSMGIVRPVMEVYPYAWAFFVPFILATAFTMLNLFIGVVVSAMQEEHDALIKAEHEEVEAELRRAAVEREGLRQASADETARVIEELRALRGEMESLRAQLASR
ncbi:MAG: ion transporter [Brevundimonas sp.]|uniref:ion transporter n=1 Tax=Brevundimonas sp. TaxID=1871086 RepID=UPI003919FD12